MIGNPLQVSPVKPCPPRSAVTPGGPWGVERPGRRRLQPLVWLPSHQLGHMGCFSLLKRPGSSGQDSASEHQSLKQGSGVRTRKPGGFKTTQNNCFSFLIAVRGGEEKNLGVRDMWTEVSWEILHAPWCYNPFLLLRKRILGETRSL